MRQDLADLEIEMTFDQIRNCNKDAFKDTVKRQVKSIAFKYLTEIQQTHSKAKMMTY